MGSPLLSPDEQAQVLRVALADVARLCGENQRDGHLPGPDRPPSIKIHDAERVFVGRSPATRPTLSNSVSADVIAAQLTL
ncbi:MAG: hypothetical protein Gyms2KO_02880 [Gymnodinialimonas sp.]